MSKKDKHIKSVENEPKFLKPYYYSQKTKIFLGIIIGIAAIIFILLDFVKIDEEKELLKYLISFAKQLSLLITSIIGTEFILSLSLEKRNQNNAFKEFFCEEFIESDIFTDLVPISKQKVISDKYRIENEFDNRDIVLQMMNYAQRKLCENLSDFYYEKCVYYTNCSIEKNKFKKDIRKVIHIRSLKGTINKKKFPIVTIYTQKANEKIQKEKPVVKIKGTNDKKYRTLNLEKDCICEHEVIDEILRGKNGFDCKTTFYLRNTILLKEDEDFCIDVNIFQYAELADYLSTVFRVQVPCKTFSITFNAPESYVVKPNAFGYIDRSQEAVNGKEQENVKIEFDGWIFPDDGAIIGVEKK